MRIFKTKLFARFARKERIGDKKLCDEVERIEAGSLMLIWGLTSTSSG